MSITSETRSSIIRQDSVSDRIAAKIGIAREGIPVAAPALAAGIALLLVWAWAGGALLVVAVALLVLAVALGAFFRDPERYPPQRRSDTTVLSAADGRICDIVADSGPDDSLAGYTRISVFMSPLNVHVNRAPVSGEVSGIRHTPGEFRAAFRDSASEHNERNVIKFIDRAGREHVIVQIAGYLARRIVCRVEPHSRLQRGQRLGLIMFGSRVDHFLPGEYRVTVGPGDRVRAGETVIGEL